MRRTLIGPQSFKGHAALSNPPGRFDKQRLESIDDGWFVDESPESIPTTLEPDRAREVITTNDSPDIGFDQSINPYRGCATACVYCYARPSHAYLGLSPGLDFETRLFYKDNAAAVLEKQLAKPGYVCKTIMLGANTDPYQPVERRMKITRSILEVLLRTQHPVSLITKHALVLRDLDLIEPLARQGLASVAVSVTTLDNELKRTLEPQAAAPLARLRTLKELNAAGVPTMVMVAPVIPAVNDAEIEAILEACAAAGVRHAAYVLLRLPYELKELFREWLEKHYPQRAAHVMSLIRDMRGGRDNDPSFGTRMRGTGPYAELLRRRFHVACRRLGLNSTPRAALHTNRFIRPVQSGPQLNLGL